MDMKRSIDQLKEHCDNDNFIFRILTWVYLIYLAAVAALGLWLAFRPAAEFSLVLTDTGNGVTGYVYYNKDLGVFLETLLEHLIHLDFSRGMLSMNAAGQAKGVWLLGYANGFVLRLMVLAVLWEVAEIFRCMDRKGTPFAERSIRTLRWLRRGGFVLFLGWWLVYILILGLSGWSGSRLLPAGTYFLVTMAISGMLCLSFVFEYGLFLQRESDETL